MGNPPAGIINLLDEKAIHVLSGECVGAADISICRETFMMQSGLALLVKKDGVTLAKKFWPSPSGFFYRFLGAPTVAIYKIIPIKDNQVGIVHSYGFTLVKDGKYCTTVELDRNFPTSFADVDGKILLSSRETGWRLYDEEKFCKGPVEAGP